MSCDNTFNPIVSILIPCFNAEKYIEEAILSALNQTWTNIELIIVDDGSTDNSLSCARKYESEKVKVFTLAHTGAPRARNFAFQQSTGDYIQYLDADDLLAPNKIEEQVKILEEFGTGCLTFCSYTRDYDDFRKGIYILQGINKDYSNPVDLFLDIFNSKGNVLITSWLFHREMIEEVGPMNEHLVKAIDGDFVVKIALKCKSLIYCAETLVFYRSTDYGRITTSQTPEAIHSVIMSTEIIQDTIFKYEESERVKKALIALYSQIFCSYYSCRNRMHLRKVEVEINNLGGKLEFIGNKYFKLLSRTIGVKNALLAKRALKSIHK